MRARSWFLTAICLIASHDLAAIECIEVSQRQAFRHVFVVFRGTVVRIQPMPDVSAEPMLVTFRVDRGWKGPVTETMRVFVFGSPALGDGYHFHEGERYIVYGTNDVPQDFENLPSLSGGTVVFGIGTGCIWRIRSDVDQESHKLHWGHRPASDP